jgi:hypothetical protein
MLVSGASVALAQQAVSGLLWGRAYPIWAVRWNRASESASLERPVLAGQAARERPVDAE